MDSTDQILRAMPTDLARLEERVWARNPDDACTSDRRGEMLAYLMTPDESRQWRSLGARVAEMRKLL